MDFNFTAEQVQLRSTVKGYLDRHHDFATRRSLIQSESGWSEALWRGFAQDLGVTALANPEPSGGHGSNWVDLMVVMEEMGASLVTAPYLDTAVIAAGLLDAVGGEDERLNQIGAGTARYAFAWAEPSGRYSLAPRETVARRHDDTWVLEGTKTLVIGAPFATDLLVTVDLGDGPGLFAVAPDLPGVKLTAYPTIDGRRAADIHFADVRLPSSALLLRGAEAIAAVEWITDIATALTGAEALGVLRCLLDQTLDYTRLRRQFGRPIAEFQVLQHRMVDMYMHLEMAKSAVYRALLSLDLPAAERARAVSAMKVTVGDACRFVGQSAIQLHGGMGMTDELAVGHYFKRATAIELDYGSTDFHLRRFDLLSRASAG